MKKFTEVIKTVISILEKIKLQFQGLTKDEIVRIGWLIVTALLCILFMRDIETGFFAAMFVALIKYINK